MKNIILFALILTKVLIAFSAAPSLDFILSKTVATTGRQVLQIDQDVIFKIGEQESVVSETWIIEGDKNLILTAKGKGNVKNLIQLNYFFNNKIKTFLVNNSKMTSPISSDFFQNILFARSTNAFKNYLSEWSISELVRFSRADGKIAFAIGDSSTLQKINPQVWIDQDEFLIRKIRLPSAAVIEFSDAKNGKNNLLIPKTQKISWAQNTVEIKIKNISIKNEINLAAFSPQNLSQHSEFNFNEKSDLTDLITQFYQRFR